MRILLTITLLLGVLAMGAGQAIVQSIEKNGMEVRWEIRADTLAVWMSAPTNGWLAIGFNTENRLKGTSLVMVRVREGEPEAVDFYVLAPGDYQPVTQLGGVSQIRTISGTESVSGTQVHCGLVLRPSSKWHHELRAGASYTMLLAYSQSDDFNHHSMMRTSIAITL